MSKWASDSSHGGLLFILFKDRIYNPADYSAPDIYNNELLPFQEYSKKNFKTYCQTAANRCIKFERNGTGITQAFRAFVKEARVEFSDLIARLKGTGLLQDEEDEDDDSYSSGDSESDVSFQADDDIISLSSLIRHASLDPRSSYSSKSLSTTAIMPTEKKTKKPAAKSNDLVKMGRSPTICDPYIIPYPGNDKIFCQFPMGGNVDED